MPRPSKGARLYRRKDGTWSILDGKIERRTGETDRRQAEIRLAKYINAKGQPSGPDDPGTAKIGDMLAVYLEEHAPHTADPARIAYAADPLIAFWGELTVAAITKNTCRRYAAQRVRETRDGTTTPISNGTIRRELGVLRAALKYCVGEGRLTIAPVVHLPDKPPARDRWLTRQEAAKLVWAARRNRHLAYFILIALYTGTRKSAILSLSFTPQVRGGWVDCEAGVIHRIGTEEGQTAKRRPPVRMPRKLLGHMRRLRKGGSRWAVQYQGQRVGDVKTAWAKVVAETGLKDVKIHTLRHTAITWAMHKGAPLADAAGYFGLSIAMLERTYLHHHPSFQQQTAEAMNRA